MPFEGLRAAVRQVGPTRRIAHLLAVQLIASAAAACASHVPSPPSTIQIPTAAFGRVSATTTATSAPDESASPVPVDAGDPSWGSRTALVTIVEFADFECVFCARVEPTLTEMQQRYGPADLRIVYKHLPLPFHPHARVAAEASQGVFALGGGDAFWRFSQRAYDTKTGLPDGFEDTWAKAAGVSMSAFRDGMRAHTWASRVDDDMALAQKLGVTGTPTFFINGVSVSGAQPAEVFVKQIDEAVVQAKEALNRGSTREQLYVLTSTSNRNSRLSDAGLEAAHANDEPEPDTTVWHVPIGKSPVRGPSSALVTIVEFADFQCPYCARVEPVLKKIQSTYGARIRVVWKNEVLPFHPRAEPAAELAFEARTERGDAGFWEVHDRILAHSANLEDADLLEIAKGASLKESAVTSAMRGHTYKRVFDQDADLAEEVGAQGTPHFFINGRKLVGSRPFEEFQKIIDEEEPKAQALVAKGVSPSNVYETLMKTAARHVDPPPPEKKAVAVPPNAPSRGGASAPVVIQEFSDFQCPYCGRVESTLQEVLRKYPGKVRIVWRNGPLPFHGDAESAAEAAMEAYRQKGNEAFWKMHERLFANQAVSGGLERAALERYAAEVGLDTKAFADALDTRKHKAAILADDKAATDAQLQGRPAFVVNGYVVMGAQPYATFRSVVDRALLEAKGAK